LGKGREQGYKKLREPVRWVPRKDAGLPDKMHTQKTRIRRKFFITFLPSSKAALPLSRQTGCSSKQLSKACGENQQQEARAVSG